MPKRKKNTSILTFISSIALMTIIATGGIYIWKRLNPVPAPTKFIELPKNFKSYGIDVSHHQQKIDWDKVFLNTDSLISFVYCKATEGVQHIDSQWKRNREILLQKKIAHGAYHFFLPKSPALKQANHFLNQYQLNTNDLPPVLDVETEGYSDEDVVKRMKIWLNYVEDNTGRRPIIYTSYNMYKGLLKEHFNNYKFWVANYGRKESRFQDDEIIHWQYSDNGKIPGIKGQVDLNFSKIVF